MGILLMSSDKQIIVSAESSYSIQEIEDPDRDWVNMDSRQYYPDVGVRSTDILAVDYYSNSNFLNATLWLYFPFIAKPSYTSVNYGMLIDADFDKETGFDGIDYQFEIKWDESRGAWNKTLEAWSPNGDERTIDFKHNYTNFYEQDGNYVMLSLDLDQIGSPSKYKVIFYAEVERDGISFTDFTRWVALPPPQLIISTSPNSIELHKGGEKTIEVKLNSSQGYEPNVNIYAVSTVNNIKVEFPQNDTLRIPTYGLATTPLTIIASPDASVGPYTLFIFANSSFPSEELVEVESAAKEDSTFYSTLPTENILTQSSVALTIQEPLTWVDNVSDFWTKVGSPISFIYGILAGISPWIYGRIRGRINYHKKKNNN
jgi:hypothetical protein